MGSDLWQGWIVGCGERNEMKTKIEKEMDVEFEKFGVKVWIYHFRERVRPFNGITIVDDSNTWTWIYMRRVIDRVFKREYLWMHNCCPATRYIESLRLDHIYGVAICDKRDQFNRQRGRIIAKGRLLKHIKERE